MSKLQYVNTDLQNAAKIVNSPNPSAGGDVANKTYVDNAVLGVNAPIGVKARTTGNVTISTALNSGDTVDGVTLANGDLVLADNQTTASEDGVYVVGAVPSRSGLLAAGEDARGLMVVVESGTANGGKLFIQTANPAIVGTDGLTFTNIGAGTTYTADGNGIELSSTTFSLELDGTTLTKSSSGLRIGSGAAGAGLVESSGVLAVGAGTGVTVNANDVAADFSTVARWNSALGPASAGSSITQAHGLAKKTVIVQVTLESTGEVITDGVDVVIDTTNIVVTFAASQADRSAFRITWVG